MPTRFPTGLNANSPADSLSGLPLPLLNTGWVTYFEDFMVHPPVTAAGTGGFGWNYVSLTAAGSITTVASAGLNSGLLGLVTAANANGGVNVYPGGGVADGQAAAVSLGTATRTKEFIIGARFQLGAVATSGMGFGFVPPASMNDGSGTTTDICAAATDPVSGILVRKGSGATSIICDMYAGSAKLVTSMTVLAAASTAAGTYYKVVVHYKPRDNSLNVYLNDALVARANPSATIGSTGLLPFMAARADGSNATARTITFDYLTYAVKTARV